MLKRKGKSAKPSPIPSDEENEKRAGNFQQKGNPLKIRNQPPVKTSQKSSGESFTPSKTIESKKCFLKFLISEANENQLQQSIYDVEKDQLEAMKELLNQAISHNANFAESFEKIAPTSKGVERNQQIIDHILTAEKVKRSTLRNNSALLKYLLHEGFNEYRKKTKKGLTESEAEGSSNEKEREEKGATQRRAPKRKAEKQLSEESEEEEENDSHDNDEVFSSESEGSEDSYIVQEETFEERESDDEEEEEESSEDDTQTMLQDAKGRELELVRQESFFLPESESESE